MERQERVQVSVFTHVDKDRFVKDIYTLRKPAVLKGVPLGPCLENWTVDYLKAKGGGLNVKVHVSSVPQMDFLHKNFIYRHVFSSKTVCFTHCKDMAAEDDCMGLLEDWDTLTPKTPNHFVSSVPMTLPFNSFVQRAASESEHEEFFISKDESYYLRSLGEDARTEPADLRKQFPDLAQDFQMPPFFEPEQFFSSVFRISSPGLQLWTHYDVMDNLLAQVTGRKRVVLYSPQDALNLYLSGDKSEVLDIDCPDLERYPDFVKACRYECVLEPGDLLFIPALWFHNTLALQFGVGVNVFWRHLPLDSYDKKDAYGNKDPVAALRALQTLERALGLLEELPAEYRDFYARRMVLRIQNRSYSNT